MIHPNRTKDKVPVQAIILRLRITQPHTPQIHPFDSLVSNRVFGVLGG